MSKDFKICIKCDERLYNELRSKLTDRGYSVAGRLSRVATVNKTIFENALDLMTEPELDTMLGKIKQYLI